MKRVFTDERFPSIQIINNGSGTFEVWVGGKLEDTFESWENQDGTVSDAFAQRRADDYFERMASFDLTGEFERQMLDRSPEVADKLAQKPSASEIETLMARERVETDPVRKDALRKQILDLMRREESVAESVVNHLLGL